MEEGSQKVFTFDGFRNLLRTISGLGGKPPVDDEFIEKLWEQYQTDLEDIVQTRTEQLTSIPLTSGQKATKAFQQVWNLLLAPFHFLQNVIYKILDAIFATKAIAIWIVPVLMFILYLVARPMDMDFKNGKINQCQDIKSELEIQKDTYKTLKKQCRAK